MHCPSASPLVCALREKRWSTKKAPPPPGTALRGQKRLWWLRMVGGRIIERGGGVIDGGEVSDIEAHFGPPLLGGPRRHRPGPRAAPPCTPHRLRPPAATPHSSGRGWKVRV